MQSIRSPQQLPLDLAMLPAMGREDFLIGPENREASGWIDSWPEWPAPALILSGPAASGKSHLLAVWREMSKAALIDPKELTSQSAEDLANRGEHLAIDGVDPWIGERAAETTLFHLYNICKENGRSLLISMRAAPARIDFAIADLASRLRAAPVALIHPPEDALLAALLIKQFHDRQITISEDVIHYILPRMERSFDAVRDIVETADRLALAEQRRISVPLMRTILSQMHSE
jgi:DnaA regulatory inactivator Hda